VEKWQVRMFAASPAELQEHERGGETILIQRRYYGATPRLRAPRVTVYIQGTGPRRLSQ
jgi:hypothetical protein